MVPAIPPIETVTTVIHDGQKPGTSGLRKRVKVFQQEHYTENFVQATLSAMPGGCEGKTLVVGGDGRYFSPEAVQIILRLAAGNGLKKIIVGQNTILSTPAASALIRARKTDGGILLTASHNPGGPDADFGIKFNCENGGPAPEEVTDRIYKLTQEIKSYKSMVALPDLELSRVGNYTHGPLEVEVVDCVENYIELLKEIFDFDMIREWLQGPGKPTVLFDALSGVTGPYGRAIFQNVLGLDASVCMNCDPKPDFGGHHPDPNLTYAHELVEAVEKDKILFGAASDGDGDRNMIYGAGAFVTPSDSVAIIADWAERAIPYFKSGIKGLARSMPTSEAIDLVARAKKLEAFEVPTGWKFFGNLMDAGRLSICGEESFGTGSDHIREKDGLWAIVAWLSVLACAAKELDNPKVTIRDVQMAHWQKYGRNFFSRYDYEEVESEGANKMVDRLRSQFTSGELKGKSFSSGSTSFEVKETGDFEYKDPIDGSVSRKQGLFVKFTDGSRLVIRLSGTGSSGATVRLYVEKYSKNPEEYGLEAADGLKPLIDVALEMSQLREFTGREKPTVIT